jgi:hypothetical protein
VSISIPTCTGQSQERPRREGNVHRDSLFTEKILCADTGGQTHHDSAPEGNRYDHIGETRMGIHVRRNAITGSITIHCQLLRQERDWGGCRKGCIRDSCSRMGRSHCMVFHLCSLAVDPALFQLLHIQPSQPLHPLKKELKHFWNLLWTISGVGRTRALDVVHNVIEHETVVLHLTKAHFVPWLVVDELVRQGRQRTEQSTQRNVSSVKKTSRCCQ